MKARFWLPFATMGAALAVGDPPSLAQESEAQLLDGTELEYTYTDGGGVVLTFYDGLLKYRWIAGPFAGAMGEGLVYRARAIADDIYLVNWHDTAGSSFVTLVIDLQSRALYSSAILGYGTDQKLTLFDEAVIERGQIGNAQYH